LQSAVTHIATPVWPALELNEWAETYDTLHRWAQIIGKTRLRLAPMQNHWWHVTLYLTARGLSTSPMPAGAFEVEVEMDFIDHALVVRTSDGRIVSSSLVAEPVAEFYSRYMALLTQLGVHAHIWPVPVEMSDTLRFDEDRVHDSYDLDAAHRCWRVLAEADRVFKTFRGGFLGKSSPSHFWWGGFDLACTRFSGRPAPIHPGGIPNCPDYVTREGYSHECISVGWWPGTIGGLEQPAFYAYAYPEPPGCPTAPIKPEGAYYHGELHEWILPYDVMRTSSNPTTTLLDFCESTYSAAADRGHWDRASLERTSRTPPGG